MAIIEIYRENRFIGKEYFINQCIIIQDSSGEIGWSTDISSKAKPGTIKIMINAASVNPFIAFLLPDWELVLNGEVQEHKFYPDDITDLKGKKVELCYKEYKFRFDFDLYSEWIYEELNVYSR